MIIAALALLPLKRGVVVAGVGLDFSELVLGAAALILFARKPTLRGMVLVQAIPLVVAISAASLVAGITLGSAKIVASMVFHAAIGGFVARSFGSSRSAFTVGSWAGLALVVGALVWETVAGVPRIGFLLSTPNEMAHVAGFLALLVVALAPSSEVGWRSAVALGSGAMAVWASGSRAAGIAFVLCCVGLFVAGGKWRRVGPLLLLSIPLLWIGTTLPATELLQQRWSVDPTEALEVDHSLRIRSEINRIGWEAFTEYPVFGIGPGRFAELTQGIRGTDPLASHNYYLELMATAGVVGVLGFLCLLVTSLAVAWKRWRGGFFAIAFVLLHLAAFNGGHLIPLWVAVGLGLSWHGLPAWRPATFAPGLPVAGGLRR